MMEKQFKVTNISPNGMTGLFWWGKDNLSVYDITKLLNDLIEENEELISALKELKEIGDYQAYRIQELDDENEQLRQQLLYDGTDVCNICKHEYLVPSGDYFIAKCKKGHKGCSKEDVKYCEDFEKELEE